LVTGLNVGPPQLGVWSAADTALIVDTECSVAKQYFATVTGGNDKMTASRLISEHHGVL